MSALKKTNLKGEHKELARTKLFWLALLAPMVFGFCLAILIFNAESKLIFCFEAQCVQRFFSLYKFPIAIAGLSLPLVAMVAAIHRSVETSLQISYAAIQYQEAVHTNRFGNYLKHREGFEKLFDGYCARRYSSGYKTIVLTHGFYAKIYPEASFENKDWSGQFDEARLRYLEKNAKIVVGEYNKSPKDFDCSRFLLALRNMCGIMGLKYVPQRKLRMYEGGVDLGKQLIVAGLDDNSSAIMVTARDAMSLFVLLRSYIGASYNNEFAVDWTQMNVKARVVSGANNFKIGKMTRG